MPATKLTPEQRRLRAQIAAAASWANSPDGVARTQAARQAAWQKFVTAADGDERRAKHLQREHLLRCSFKASRKAQQRRNAQGAQTNP